MTRAGRPIIRLLLFALLTLAHTGEASGLTDRPPCEPSPKAPSDPSHPPVGDGPTPVEIGFFVTELREIDAVQGSFHFRGSVHVMWCDPRRAFDPAEAGVQERLFGGPAADAEFERHWNPRGFPVNRIGGFEIMDRVIRIRHDGAVRQDMNISVDLSTAFDLRRFPFDRQTLALEVESATWDRDQVRFVPNADLTGFAEGFDMPEWRLLGVESRIEEVPVLRSNVPFARNVVEIRIARESGFYLWKGLLPLFIIVMLSRSVFWMSDESFAGGSPISATGVLTIVAYQFVLAEGLPRVAYLTLLDQIMIASFGLLAVTVVESLLVSRQPRGSEAALRIDRTARWLFPLAYGLTIIFIFWTSG
ncbi:MAG: hypothetical protein JRG86_10840 [Deltaproteobacteria bacterium]|jgi:hypothetical protein|nr:hypothetical protein [Deltaproteobacteria bacterium]